MPWFKVDDRLHDHRKARKAGKSAMGLWVLAGWRAATSPAGCPLDQPCHADVLLEIANGASS